jgi:transposase
MSTSGKGQAGEQLRRRALRLLQTGQRAPVVAHRLGVSKRSVFRWQAAHAKLGEKGFVPKSAGRPPKLAAHQTRLLVGLLKSGFLSLPQFPRENPTSKNLAGLLVEFGISYHPRHVARVLTKLGGAYTPGVGWSYQPKASRSMQRPPGRPVNPRLSAKQARWVVTQLEENLKRLEEAWASYHRKLAGAYASRTRIKKDWIEDRREVWCTPRTLQRLILEEFGMRCDFIYLRHFLRQIGWERCMGFGWLPRGGLKRFAPRGNETDT